MTEPVWRQIRRRGVVEANDLLAVLGIRSPPVDVVAMTQRLDIDLFETIERPWSGQVQITDSRAIIWVSGLESILRQRFTVAHELGHIFLGHAGHELHRDIQFDDSPNEIAANRFAANVLMPWHFVEQAIAQHGDDPRTLASVFEVSEQAMRFRLRELERLRAWRANHLKRAK